MDKINNKQKEMNNKHISEAIQVAIRLHDSINSYRFQPDVRVTYKALGQCLSSLMETLEHDKQQSTDTQ